MLQYEDYVTLIDTDTYAFTLSVQKSVFGSTATPLRLVHTKQLRHRHHNKCQVDGQNGYATHFTVPFKRIKSVVHQCYGNGDGVVRCEPTFMMCLHRPRPRPTLRQRLRQMDLGSTIMFGSVYTEPRPRPMQIFIGSVHILSVSVSVSVSV